MKRNRLIVTIILLGFILPVNVESKYAYNEDTVISNTAPSIVQDELKALTPHPNIYIDSDSDFITLGFPGYGNSTHPYIIENYNFTVPAETAIWITGTNVNFIIRNNYIDGRSTGILCMNAGTGKAAIEDNIIAGHRYSGINLHNTPGSFIENNTVYDCENEGIKTLQSPNTYIDDNDLYNCGFYIEEFSKEDYRSYDIGSKNTVNDKPFGYVKDAYNTGFASPLWGQIYFVNFTHVFLYDTSLSNVSYGLVVVFSTQVRLNNCSFSNNSEYGALFYACDDIDVKESTFQNNWYGFYGVESTDLKAENCTFVDNTEGVYTDLCDEVIIKDSTFSQETGDVWEGILIQDGNNVLIDNNIISGGLGSSIFITECENVTISNNYCTLSDDAGLWVYYTTNINATFNYFIQNDYGIMFEYGINIAIIIYNLFENNTYEGVYLDTETSLTQVYWNTFRNNNGNSSQAYDDGTSNVWYNTATLSGNWWSDYDFSGNYTISGSAGSIDLYPLNDPLFPISEYGYLGFLGMFILLSLSIVILQIYRRK